MKLKAASGRWGGREGRSGAVKRRDKPGADEARDKQGADEPRPYGFGAAV